MHGVHSTRKTFVQMSAEYHEGELWHIIGRFCGGREGGRSLALSGP